MRSPTCTSVILLAVLALILPLAVSTETTRGLSVTVKSADGSSKDVPLYSGYYALVVGCSAYNNGWRPLSYPVNDSKEVAEMLRNMGWRVELLLDPDWAKLRAALNALPTGQGQDPDMAVLFWFSGHGHTLVDATETKLGYIVPIDAPHPKTDQAGFVNRAIDMRQIETVAKLTKAKHVLMVFDSCFSGAVFEMKGAKPTPFIEDKLARPVRQLITAGTEDEEVPDLSQFKTCFVQGIRDAYADSNRDGYVTGRELGEYLAEQVANYTSGCQHPQYGTIKHPKLDKGDFVFRAKVIGIVGTAPAVGALREVGRLSPTQTMVLVSLPMAFVVVALLIVMRRRAAALSSAAKGSAQLPQLNGPDQSLDRRQHLRQEANPGEQRSFDGIVFVWIPPGEFEMGSPASESGRDDDEGPVHTVGITRGFWMGRFPVTQEQYERVMGSNPSDRRGMHLPVETVSWRDASEFCDKLSRQSGAIYRLPTEAEWEYACRAGTTTRFNTGDNQSDLDKAGWFAGNSGAQTHPVGQKAPNAWGLHDMHGNVWEWCSDYDDSGYYAKSSDSDPIGPGSGAGRVTRGGGWEGRSAHCRSANRNSSVPDYRDHNLGFRVVRSPN